MTEYHEQRQALSRFTLGALLLTECVVDVVRRELRRVADVKVEEDEVRAVLQNEVIKRDVLEGEQAASAARRVSRAGSRSLRKAREDAPDDDEKPDATPAKPLLAGG